MIDTQSIENLIEQQIKTVVDSRINSVIDDGRWIADIENKIIQHVQDRITARFSNISTIPDLVDTVKTSVSALVDQGHIPDIEKYIDQSKLQRTIDSEIQDLVNKTIDALVIDPSWVEKIEGLVNQNFAKNIVRALGEIDFNSIIVQQVDASIDRWYDRLSKNFRTNGITDLAKTTQLTVNDGVVSVTNDLSVGSLEVNSDCGIKGTLSTKDLCVTGKINTDNASWNELAETIAGRTLDALSNSWKSQLTNQVLDLAKEQGIDFQSVTIDGMKLVDGHKLNSNINRIGPLLSLEVSGDGKISNTLHVMNRRVGVNTEYPDMALGIWDEEVALSIGKHSDKTGFIGTSRDQDLAIGVNKKAYLTIDRNGLVSVDKLKVGHFRLGHASEVPGYSGNRGDIVFNSDPKPNTPFAWVCIGAYKWQPIKSA